MDTRLDNCPEHVAAVYLGFPDKIVGDLLLLRSLILTTHSDTPRAGNIVEDLRWGQPSYLTIKPVTGSTVRIGAGKCGRPAMFFHCQSRLIETFRSQYGPVFEFEGNRALIVTSTIDKVQMALADCIAQALTYKLKAPSA